MKTYQHPVCRIKTVSIHALYPIIEETLQDNRLFSLQVTGNSMVPFLYHLRDQAVLAPVGQRKFRKGDILFYQRIGGQFVLHRVYKVQKDGGMTMLGDAQWETEEGILPSQVKACVPKVIRKGKEINCEKGWYRFLMTAWQLRIRFPRAAKMALKLFRSAGKQAQQSP